MRPADLALLDDGHGHLAEALHELGLVGQELEQTVRAGEAGRSTAERILATETMSVPMP